MKDKLKIKHFFEGALLGVSLLAPGLSVATVAMVLGIYEQLLDLVNDFFSSKWKSTIMVLIPLGIGAISGVFASSHMIALATEYFPTQIYFLFLGFVLGAIPLLLKTADAKNTFKKKHVILLGIVAILVASLNWAPTSDTDHVVIGLDIVTIIRLLITGAITTSAMLLPGLSAALILLLLGTYSMLNQALSTLNIPVLIILVVGGLIGLILSSRGIKFLLNNFLDFTYAASIGMVSGSIVVIYGLAEPSLNPMELVTSFLALAVGFFGVVLLERKKANHSESIEVSEAENK